MVLLKGYNEKSNNKEISRLLSIRNGWMVLNYLYYCKVLMNIAKENVSVLQ